jgi:hypothetical protein
MSLLNQARKNTAPTTAAKTFPEGRTPCRITAIVAVGPQRAFNPEDPPVEKLAFRFTAPDGAVMEKAVSINLHTASALSGILYAAGVDLDDPDNADADLDILLNRAVVLECSLNGKFTNIEQISPVEDFDDVPPKASPGDLLYVPSVDQITREVMDRMPRLAKKLFGERVRQRGGE